MRGEYVDNLWMRADLFTITPDTAVALTDAEGEPLRDADGQWLSAERWVARFAAQHRPGWTVR